MLQRFLCVSSLVLLAGFASAQQSASDSQMSGHDMSQMQGHDMSAMPGMDSDSSAPAMHSMESHHMDMGPYMKMTALRDPKPGDAERAQKVVNAARRAMSKYEDYRTALADGFQIFHPEVPQKMYHFTNYKYAFEAILTFNPEHPTSLLYEKHGSDYKLVGVMYTAPKRYSEDDLDQRIPLSIAQWHEHVNFCAPPADRKHEVLGPNAKFGLHGSISAKEECDANGGTFHPLVFNWMVHVYPLEKAEADIWAVDRGHEHNHMD
jgi:hypothetical protein